MKTENGQIAWLSANTQRVFNTFEEALNDAKKFNYAMYDETNIKKAYNDVYVIHLWLNEE